MNTNENPSVGPQDENQTPQDNRHDCEIAKEKLQSFYNSLEIKHTISAPYGTVKDADDNKAGGGWPCIGYNILFQREITRPTRVISFATDYFLGVGHVNWKRAERNFLNKTNWKNEAICRAMAQGKILNNAKPEVASLAAQIASQQRVKPNAAEVLATVCRDVFEIDSISFEEWAVNLGYNPDSRKDEGIYLQIKGQSRAIRAFLTLGEIQKLAEFANRL